MSETKDLNQQALNHIRAARENQQTKLDLSGFELSILPAEIGDLSNLTTLNLSNNLLSILPAEIGQLRNLTILNLNNNLLSILPAEIRQLNSLEVLNLNNNLMSSLPAEIGDLSNLSFLDLKGNQLSILPAEIGDLSNLTTLNLSNNPLSNLPKEIGQLRNLAELYVMDNQLSSLPAEIGQLSSLEVLYLIGNRLSSLPAEIGQLHSLSILDLDNNQLSSLPAEIGQLSSLSMLDLRTNPLSNLPAEIGQLSNLTELYLIENPLSSLPAEIIQLNSLSILDLRGNALNIPPEILNEYRNPRTILNYYFTTLEKPTSPLHEIKMVVVGQGSVGKTSLVKGLLTNEFDTHENKTEGISISRWALELVDRNIRVNVWDFGGQEIMHATHQFFLTQRSIYLLVLDARVDEAENRLDYWLKIIESYAGDSPIIIVGNKIDQQALDLDEGGLLEKYPQVKAILATSCKSGEGLPLLHQRIQELVRDLPHVNDKLPESWFTVKDRLEEMPDDHIPFERYEEHCLDAGVEEAIDQKTLIGFLHDLGTVLNFRDDSSIPIQQTQVLDPEWVTNGVYQILNARSLLEKGGIFQWADLLAILAPPDYTSDQQRAFIIDMMKKFELCYGDYPQSYLVPDLLRKEKVETGEWDDALVFEYHYDVLPTSLLARFMVRRSTDIAPGLLWRNGVVLKDEHNQALILADRAEKVIRIAVRGDGITRRDFLAVLRAEMNAINATLPNLDVKQYIPAPDNPRVLVNYANVLAQARKGVKQFIPPGMEDFVNVRDLLGEYQSPEERQAEELRKKDDTFQKKAIKDLDDIKRRIDTKEKPVPPAKLPAPAPPAAPNPILSILPYLIVFLTVSTFIAGLFIYLHWAVVPLVIVGGLIALVTISALQLQFDGKTKDTTFIQVITLAFKQIPLLFKGQLQIPGASQDSTSVPHKSKEDKDSKETPSRKS